MNRFDSGGAGNGGAPPPLLVLTQGSGRSLAGGPSYLVGRDPEADIVIYDRRVSWQHAVLRLEDGRWVLADNGSTNGSYAEGRRADRIEIDGEVPGPARRSCPRAGPELHRQGRPTLRIGRSLDNDIVVDLSVSSHHAELHTVAGVYRIVDLGSHNGTFVNEQRVTAAPLSEGDTVGLGDSTFRLVGRELQELASTGEAQMPALLLSPPPPGPSAPCPVPPGAARRRPARRRPARRRPARRRPARCRPARRCYARRRGRRRRPGRDPVRGSLAGAEGRAVRELRHPERQRHAARLLPPVRPHLRGRDPDQEVAARRRLRPRTPRRGGGGRGAVRQARRGDQLLRPVRQLPRRRHLGDRRRRARRAGPPGDAALVRALCTSGPSSSG